MVIYLEDKKRHEVNVEIMSRKTNKGIEFSGKADKIEIQALLPEGKQFLTETDVKIKGITPTSVEDLIDQMNEYFEEDI